jgi:hypothetical protein
MAIRIRQINGVTIALCAAETDAKPGDLYLDDNIHHALTTKFGLDWQSEGILAESLADPILARLMLTEKVRPSKDVEIMLRTWRTHYGWRAEVDGLSDNEHEDRDLRTKSKFSRLHAVTHLCHKLEWEFGRKFVFEKVDRETFVAISKSSWEYRNK